MKDESVATSFGRARLVALEQVRDLTAWQVSFAGNAKDRPYYELLAETLNEQFDFRWIVLEDEGGKTRAVQPIFFVLQDVLATAPRAIEAAAKSLRALSPNLLKLRMLMVGCAAGAGDLGQAEELEHRWKITALCEALPHLARLTGASLIVWKDFPAAFRPMLQAETAAAGFARLSSMPATRLKLGFADFEDYLQRHLSHAMRKNLRRKFKATADVPLTFEVTQTLAGAIDEAYPLYEQVLARSPLQFERLTKPFLLGLGERLPERTQFFLWRQQGRLVAFNVCLVHGGAIYDEYLGLDYRVALDLHLYFVTLRDVLTWAIRSGLHTYLSTPLNYDPKLHLGFELVPLDLYVAATSQWLQPVTRFALRWIEPARAEPKLRLFPNAHELNSL